MTLHSHRASQLFQHWGEAAIATLRSPLSPSCGSCGIRPPECGVAQGANRDRGGGQSPLRWGFLVSFSMLAMEIHQKRKAGVARTSSDIHVVNRLNHRTETVTPAGSLETCGNSSSLVSRIMGLFLVVARIIDWINRHQLVLSNIHKPLKHYGYCLTQTNDEISKSRNTTKPLNTMD